jgi:E3 ubiquitin-protein ligase HUWE1
LIRLLQIKSVSKMCFRNAHDSTNSFNFIKLYVDALKNFDVRSYYIYEKELQFISETLATLFNMAIYLLFYKPSVL